MNDFKITLAAARVNAGMTQEEVAKEMHVSKNTIVNWENGKVEMKQHNLKCSVLLSKPQKIVLFYLKYNLKL